MNDVKQQPPVEPEGGMKGHPLAGDDTDTEAHGIPAEAGIEPEGAARYHPFTGDDDATGLEPDSALKLRP